MKYQVCIKGVYQDEVKYFHKGTQFSSFSYTKATDLTREQAEFISTLYEGSFVISEEDSRFLYESSKLDRIKTELVDYRKEQGKGAYVDALTMALMFLDSYNRDKQFTKEEAMSLVEEFYR